WRRDWISAVWALKSFFHACGQTYPLYIHDGGLDASHAEQMMQHFPGAKFVGRDDGDRQVVGELRRRGFDRSASYRQRNGTVRKLFDFFLMSQADALITIDSDIVFFRRPDE